MENPVSFPHPSHSVSLSEVLDFGNRFRIKVTTHTDHGSCAVEETEYLTLSRNALRTLVNELVAVGIIPSTQSAELETLRKEYQFLRNLFEAVIKPR